MAFFPKRYYPDYPGPPMPPGPSYSPYRSQYPPVPMDSGYPMAGPVYGTEYPPVTTKVNPPPETSTKSDEKDQIINQRYKYLGYALLLLSVAIFALEIANVIFTYSTFSVSTSTYVKSSFATPYILTWVAPGIWGAIPLFMTGRLAISVAGKNNKMVRIFALLCALSGIVFAPAITAISIAELVMYPSYPAGDSQPMVNGYVCYSLSNSATLSCPKFVLPLVVAVLGGIAFYLTLMVTLVFCCCWKPESGKTEETVTTEEIDEYIPIPRNPPYEPVNNQLMRLPAVRPYFVTVPVYRAAPQMMIEPDMNFLRSYPMYRPAASRGFGFAPVENTGYGFAPAYNRQSYGNFPGSLPSLTSSFGNLEPNPAYKVVYA